MEKVARLKAGAGKANVEVKIGDLNWGQYHLYLWDAEGLNHTDVGAGLNTDKIPDAFSIGAPASLNGKMLSWQVHLASYVGGSQPYDLVVEITQGGAVVPGGSIVRQGEMDGAVAIGDFVRFLVV